MTSYALLFAVSIFAVGVVGHPAPFPAQVTSTGVYDAASDLAEPMIVSWHAHIVFNLAHYDEAIALRNRTMREFKEYLSPEVCTTRFDDSRLCMILDHELDKVLLVGPFPAGEWSIFVPVHYYSLVQPWLVQNRGNFSLLFHPNSGYMVDDHTKWASWTGASWPLNTDPNILGPAHQKTNEFNHHRGDPENPQCAPEGLVCGDMVRGPVVLCCPGASCEFSTTRQLFECQSSAYNTNTLRA